ncbi:MAG: DUF2283 domain-containing protein [Dehalococcoidia bacterium]|nr:DUF2283 domain-containing protein [Dehalococcoidia bacterium]
MDAPTIDQVRQAVPLLLRYRDFNWDYDAQADVLYISLERPQRATDSDVTDDDIVLSYRGDKLVGITVLHASQRDGLTLRD